MKEILVSIIIILFSVSKVSAQATFEAPDTVCTGDSMLVINQSGDATTYYWNFCSGNLRYDPDGEKITQISGLDAPAFMEIVKDGNDFYAFITNHLNGSIVRSYFGNNLLNEPVSINFGNFGGTLPDHLEGIQVKKEGENWYGFVAGGVGRFSSLIRLDFGNSLNNTPTAVNLGNIGELDYPIDLYIFQTDNEWFGYTVNFTSSTITRFHFVNGLHNEPIGTNLGNIGNLDSPCGIHPIMQDRNWYIFITNNQSNTISRLDFGNSILNEPSGINLGGNGSLHRPFDITIVRDCERVFGFVVNQFDNSISKITFNESAANYPLFESMGNIGNLSQPHGFSRVFREGNNLYLFVANVADNSFTRLYFPGCDNAIPPWSNAKNPGKVTYNQPGEYNVILVLDEGLPTSDIYCKPIIAFDNPVVSLGNDTSILPGTTITLSPGSEYVAYNWSTRESGSEITVNRPGQYLVEVTDSNGCKNSDDIIVSIKFYIPEFFTPNGDGTNDTWEVEYLKTFNGVKIFIYDRSGKLLTDEGQGWDGTYKGMQMPADSYWYLITFNDGSAPVHGFFSIIR